MGWKVGGGGNGCSVVGQRLCFYYTCYLVAGSATVAM